MKARSQIVAPSVRVRRYRFGDDQRLMKRYLGSLDNAAEPDHIATSAQIRGPPTSTASHGKPPTLSHETVILRELYVTPMCQTATYASAVSVHHVTVHTAESFSPCSRQSPVRSQSHRPLRQILCPKQPGETEPG
ncbi:hypothetical protein CNYM01_13250 [Colletotrichum nymphaeae SA-01]|uniref:Uncharacterized protein n=1 Tax=Colletotrichum nymphaeae SA-01 TaxID=1460502 RepID=A0A135SY79_9PEZI|nr:hypothetical protein CNYM01_13250 [Colletotrichum nymphaeae SA-01]